MGDAPGIIRVAIEIRDVAPGAFASVSDTRLIVNGALEFAWMDSAPMILARAQPGLAPADPPALLICQV